MGAYAGERELEQRARDYAARLPEPLAPLAHVAFNLRWSWDPEAREAFARFDPVRWSASDQNPLRLLLGAPAAWLARAAGDGELVALGERALRRLNDELHAPASPAGVATPERPIAFFCAEYGVHASLPIYAGGLGVLAGDFLKEASDRRIPMVGVGLLYRQGYFHQRLDTSGWQHEYWTTLDPVQLPMAIVRRDDGEPLTITVPIGAAPVVAQIWRVDVGRVPLYLLDTNRPENARFDRWITARLYEGDREIRRAQYLLLGLGGVRALRALGIDPSLLHLNEGHAAFATLELTRELVAAGVPFADALARAKQRAVFTTHTPVPAGNELYSDSDILQTSRDLVRALGIDDGSFLDVGRTRPRDASEPFGMTPLALRTTKHANGVSRRHGRVARAMWQGMWPERGVDAVPIGHVTNGVHLPTWMSLPMRRLLDRHLGDGWDRRASDPALWGRVDAIPDEELWAVRSELRRRLVDHVRERSVVDRLSRGDRRDYVEAAERTFDPGTLTVGFARRLATYKRLHLLTQDIGRALRLLVGDRPVQLLIAGKAHPQDDGAKRIVQQQLFPVRGAPEVGQRVAYLEDYDMAMAAELVAGCDLWLNFPRPPLEASGTSGMKVALNGGLNLSVLDGWWEEAFDGTNGWAISGDLVEDAAAQDARDAGAFYFAVEKEIVPSFYTRDAAGVPREWLRRVKASLRTLGPRFCATRMIEDYVRTVYAPGE